MTSTAISTPRVRIRALNALSATADREFVLYWMIACRRPHSNFALQRAAELARRLGRPLLVLEALRVDYPWASDRFHRFVLEGMRDNARTFAGKGTAYHAYVEPAPGAGRGLLAALSKHACAIVTDDYPTAGIPGMLRAAAGQVSCAMEAVDSNGLLPLAEGASAFPSAYAFRRHLQRRLLPHLTTELPLADPLAPDGPGNGARPADDAPAPAAWPAEIAARWPTVPREALHGDEAALRELLASLPIAHDVPPAATRGGHRAARAALDAFLHDRLARYAEERNHPDAPASSGLSPYLHFGHLSAHEVFEAVASRDAWRPSKVSASAGGKRAGWWGVGEGAEAFLDQLVTWRELGFHECARNAQHDRYESLPAWARATLEKHAADPRPWRYPLDELEAATTHDPLWNAAQRELVREGRIHNYLRMLWGKKILEWSAGPREAFEMMFHLNNKYALDGRDPNSSSGIAWILGRYDRPWGPERPIFGTVRYMSSENTARKLHVKQYVARYGP